MTEKVEAAVDKLIASRKNKHTDGYAAAVGVLTVLLADVMMDLPKSRQESILKFMEGMSNGK